MSIATIIVNYNAGETLQQCVVALLKSTEPTTITIFDNASSDHSAENLQSFFEYWQLNLLRSLDSVI